MKMNHWLLTVASIFLVSCTPCPPCETAAATGAGDPPRATKPITPGVYNVCNLGSSTSHGDVVGTHLDAAEVVEIKKIDADSATKVCLRKPCAEGGADRPDSEGKIMWLNGNDQKLSGADRFEHMNEQGATVQVAHLVKIEPESAPPGTCKARNVLRISICVMSDDGEEWKCTGTSPDFGHVHVEN